MKRITLIVLALLLLFSLAACGGNGASSTDTTTSPPSSEGASSTPNTASGDGTGVGGGGDYKGHPILSDYASLTNAGAFDMFSRFGLNDEVALPEGTLGITRYTEDPYSDPFVRTEYGFEMAQEPEDDAFFDYARAVYEATKAASDDGNIYVWWSGSWDTTDDDGHMITESYGDVRGNALFATLQTWSFKHDGRNWTATVSTDESAAPYSHWEIKLDISTALSDISTIVDGEHTPEPTPFVDSYLAEADVVGKTIPGERLVYIDNWTEPGKDYNFFAERVYYVWLFDSEGKTEESWTYYFYDDEGTYEKGLEKNLADDLWDKPPAIASKMSLYIAEGGSALFATHETYDELFNDITTRGGAYTVVE